MGLIQRLYLFTITGFVLVMIVFSLIFWFLNALNSAMEKVDYTQQVGEVVDQLQLHIFEKKLNLAYPDTNDWLTDQERFLEIVEVAPLLSPSQQTLQNSIINQNASLIILFKQIQQVSQQFPKSKIESHLNTRLLAQIEVIREDCLELVANADQSLRQVMRKLFYLIAFILVVTACGLTWGAFQLDGSLNPQLERSSKGLMKL
ncbi:hypothetical protein ACLKMH_06050 [Psychromonas sp. KJ10-10]|uniref:hypothetical protein n=1 Tax=Psychromonas sp. KJ10-10 TaxID=3391823 RepID=UPI0039B6E3F4